MDRKKLKLDELNRLSVDEFKAMPKQNLTLVLDDVRSAHNVGSVFRTSDAFAVDKIYLCGITPKPPQKEIRKTALGATDSVAWEYHENALDLIQTLKKEGHRVLAVEQAMNSIPLTTITFERNEKVVLILGHEVHGVNQDLVNLAHGVVEVPQLGTKHSLNVSVCAGVLVWEYYRQMQQPE